MCVMHVEATIRALHRHVVPGRHDAMRRRVDAFLIVRYVSMLSAHALRASMHLCIALYAPTDDRYRVTHSFSRLSRVEEVCLCLERS